MTSHTGLVEEIERILHCPYPTQLKTLRDVAVRSSVSDIQIWATQHTCQVRSLAEIVLEALRSWSYVLDIVSSLSASIEFRDALLRSQPLLLDGIVSSGCDEQASAGEAHIDAAVSLLRYDLPHDVPLPASAQSLLVQLFEQAAAQPIVHSLQRIHTLLTGACRPLISLLSAVQCSRFEQLTFTILRNTSDVENHSLDLYCLGIMRAIVEALEAGSPRRRPDAMRSFFRGPKAHKTLQLIALRVIWACKAGLTEGGDDVLCSVRLAIEVLEGVDGETLQEWRTKNPALLRKLVEKCVSPDLAAPLQLLALTFLFAIGDSSDLPGRSHIVFGRILLQDDSSAGLSQYDRATVLRLGFRALTAHLDEVWWHDLVLEALGLALDIDPCASAGAMCFDIIEFAFRHLDVSPVVCKGVRLALEETDRFQHLLSSEALPTTAADRSHCLANDYRVRRSLHVSISSFILKIGLTMGSTEDPGLTDMFVQIASKLATTGLHSESCMHESRKPTKRFEDFARGDQVSVRQNSIPWRERLEFVIRDHADQQQHLILSELGSICQELEVRCENVEAPLRKEKAHTAAAEVRITEIQKAYAALESRSTDDALRSAALEADNRRLMKRAKFGYTEVERLTQSLQDAERQLEQTQRQAKLDLDTLRNLMESAELASASRLAGMEEMLEKAQEDTSSLQRELQKLRAEAGQAENVQRDMHAKNERLCEERDLSHQELDQYRSELGKNDERLKATMAEKDAVSEELEGHRSMLERARQDGALAKDQLEETRTRSIQEVREVTGQYEEKLSSAYRELQQHRAEAERRLDRLQEQLAGLEQRSDDRNKADAATIAEMRRKIDRLTKDCTKKDAQIAEARDMRNKLMNAMGLQPPAVAAGAQTPGRSASLPFRSASSAPTPQTQPPPKTPGRRLSQSKSDDEEEEDMMNSTFGSVVHSTRKEPTPKRARPRKAFKVPTLQPGRSLMSGMQPSSRTTSYPVMASARRQPLGPLTANSSPARKGRSPGKVAFKERDEEVENALGTADNARLAEWSFTSDLLTSTPGVGLGTAERAEQDYLDQSTMDV